MAHTTQSRTRANLCARNEVLFIQYYLYLLCLLSSVNSIMTPKLDYLGQPLTINS